MDNLRSNISLAADRLFDKLKRLNVNALDISEYNKRYVSNYLKNMQETSRLYSHILAWAIAGIKVPVEEVVLLDYGGGSGILSLLARELGVGTVIYNDIYDVSCRDAKVIAEAMGNKADHYVEGNIDDVIGFLKERSISCSAVVSYDVIEHIYDIKGFLLRLPELSTGPLTVVMASGANTLNPRVRKSLMKTHLEREYQNREKGWGHKERDCLKAYFEVRKEIILSCAPGLSRDDVEYMAKVTRGMIKADIERSVAEYLKTGQFPQEPGHPTNTCDPYTGNWAEHLMDIYHLRDVLAKAGFQAEILSGLYGHHKNIIKRLLGNFLNVLIHLLGSEGVIIAPFFTLYGRRDRNVS